MQELDKKLYEILSLDYFIDRMGVMRKCQEPQLHDVFRVAKEKGCYMEIENEYDSCSIRLSRYTELSEFVYNPTLPLLQQSDTTKSALISLFE